MMKWMWICFALTSFAGVDFDKHLTIDKEEYKARREALRKELSAPVIMMGGLMRNRINDTSYEFRQESNFYYFTGFSEPGAFLVISPRPFDFKGEQVSEILFVEAATERQVIYDGKRTTPEELQAQYGIEKAAYVRDLGKWGQPGNSHFEAFLKTLVKNEPAFYLNTPIINYHEFGKNRTDYYEDYKNSMLASLQPPQLDESKEETEEIEVKSRRELYEAFSKLRSIKSPAEIAMLQRAVDVTLSGHEESLKIAKDVPYEYQVEAAIEFAFKYNGAEAVGYNSIVGCGPNGTVLHYMENRDDVNHQQMYVLDAGAEYQNYTADITRSFPADGTFSKEQKEIYNIVLDAQTAGAKEFVAGSNYNRVLGAIKQVQVEGLTKLGLIEYPVIEMPVSELKKNFNWFRYGPTEDMQVDGKTVVYKYGRFDLKALNTLDKDAKIKVFDESQYRQVCPHGWGHSVGLDVHDPAPREFAEGMIWTIEPGIYFGNNIDFEYNEAYKHIGVRIEDMYLVTKEGNVCMSESLPRDVPSLEAFMKEESHLLLRKHSHKH